MSDLSPALADEIAAEVDWRRAATEGIHYRTLMQREVVRQVVAAHQRRQEAALVVLGEIMDKLNGCPHDCYCVPDDLLNRADALFGAGEKAPFPPPSAAPVADDRGRRTPSDYRMFELGEQAAAVMQALDLEHPAYVLARDLFGDLLALRGWMNGNGPAAPAVQAPAQPEGEPELCDHPRLLPWLPCGPCKTKQLAAIRARAAQRAATMSNRPDTPEEIADLAETVEALMPLQMEAMARMDGAPVVRAVASVEAEGEDEDGERCNCGAVPLLGAAVVEKSGVTHRAHVCRPVRGRQTAANVKEPVRPTTPPLPPPSRSLTVAEGDRIEAARLAAQLAQARADLAGELAAAREAALAYSKTTGALVRERDHARVDVKRLRALLSDLVHHIDHDTQMDMTPLWAEARAALGGEPDAG